MVIMRMVELLLLLFLTSRFAKPIYHQKLKKGIANFIKSMAALGFGPTMLEFQHLVKDFVEMKSMKTRFTDNRPEYD